MPTTGEFKSTRLSKPPRAYAMPFEIKFENTPIGVCEEIYHDGTIKIRTIDFVSEEDGDTLIDRLDSYGSDILNKLPPNAQSPTILPAHVDHLLAIIRRDNTATVYLNELNITGTIRAKRNLKKGETVSTNDITGFNKITFNEVSIPKEAGIIYIFSVGWRRAMFYDLDPLNREAPRDRIYDIEARIGQLYTYLHFQKRFKITDQMWSNLFNDQWFPFISLQESTIRKLLGSAKSNLPLDNHIDEIAEEVRKILPRIIKNWKSTPIFKDHSPFLEKAAKQYTKKDYISTISILYPRIEGLMRTHQKWNDPSEKPTQKGLSNSATKHITPELGDFTPLLPMKFRQYLESVYFANFDPDAPKIKASRNSIGHGVALAEEYSLKAATISFLLIDQLSHCFNIGSIQSKTTNKT